MNSPHTVARYRLQLVKEDEDIFSRPEVLARPAEMAAFLWERVFEGLDREAMCAVYLDGCRRVTGWTLAYVGCLSRCAVEPRGLVIPALLANAANLVIAHNHPSGQTEPSAEDYFFTRRMRLACEILGLELIDHLVVAEDETGLRWTSLRAKVEDWSIPSL